VTTRGRLTFVDIARGIGALAVVYTHVQAVWLREADPALSSVSKTVSAGVLDPLYLGQDGLGRIAVVIFFLTSGYVVTPIALRLGGPRFGVNRVFRVYPLLIASVLLAGACVALGIKVLSVAGPGQVSPGSLLSNCLLLNFVFDPQSTLLGVAWTLAVEIIFYSMIIMVLPLLRRTAWLAVAVELAVVATAVSLHALLTGYLSEFATSTSVLVFPIIGQAVWAAQRRMIPLPVTGSSVLVGWLLFAWAASTGIKGLANGYEIAAAIAVLLFLIGLVAEPRLRPRAVWTFLSDRCYSLYLLHGVVTIGVLESTSPGIGMSAALLLALLATALVVEIMHRCVERPSHELGRRLSRARRGAAPVPGTDRAPAVPGAGAEESSPAMAGSLFRPSQR
jgi:peptidoglycan/LPS O-acetylase OafA/YrhL